MSAHPANPPGTASTRAAAVALGTQAEAECMGETGKAVIAGRADNLNAAWPSDALLRGQSAVHIAHNGHIYRLQATRQGKLILTK